MNNGTKSANIMTWRKFKKLFNPEMYSVSDSVFGKSFIHPTMTGPKLKLKHKQIIDVDDCYDSNLKPLDIVKDMLDFFKYDYVVYHVWKHRDLHGRGIDIYYK